MSERISVKKDHFNKFNTQALKRSDIPSNELAARLVHELRQHLEYNLDNLQARIDRIKAVMIVIEAARSGLLYKHNDNIPDIICFSCRNSRCVINPNKY